MKNIKLMGKVQTFISLGLKHSEATFLSRRRPLINNYVKLIRFKMQSSQYQYEQACQALQSLNGNTVHVAISEFCAMMETISSSIYLAQSCAYKQSAVEFNAFIATLDHLIMDELKYVDQFVRANRVNDLFTILDDFNIEIKPIIMKNKMEYYEARSLSPYMEKVKLLSEAIVKQFLSIYEESSAFYDQSWRTVDMHRSSFCCKSCGALITTILSHIGNLSSISLIENESYLPRLTYVYGYEVIRAELFPGCGADELIEDEIIIPVEGLYMNIKKQLAHDSTEFTIYCINGHQIGREVADGHAPHMVRLPKDRIHRKEIVDHTM